MLRMRNIVGSRISKARERHDPPLTQEGLAARLQLEGWDLSRGGLAKIEAGIRKVTDVEVAILSRCLKVSVAWLFGESETFM
jgi:transcriptional regulator with XRE-family HTH domain